MRVIEKQMIEIIGKKTTKAFGNMQVVYNPTSEVSAVYLHGNHIADYQHGGGVEVNKDTLFHWPTPTTCSRLRALGVRVNVVRGIPHIDGQPI